MTERVGTIVWERDSDGIVTLTLDDPSQSANTMNSAHIASMGEILDRIDAERHAITGIVLASAKSTFFAGGDLDAVIDVGPDDAAAIAEVADTVKSHLRRLETAGVPVVAALAGAALGIGLEIALAAHHRIALDHNVIVGLPEVTAGLLPGAGGIVRTVRMLGIDVALDHILLTGGQYEVGDAVMLGLIDETVSNRDELVSAAKAWIRAHPDVNIQPWDRKGFRIPGGDPYSAALAARVPALVANLRKQSQGATVPAPRAIVAAAIEGASLDIDPASRIETRYFVQLATGHLASICTA